MELLCHALREIIQVNFLTSSDQIKTSFREYLSNSSDLSIAPLLSESEMGSKATNSSSSDADSLSGERFPDEEIQSISSDVSGRTVSQTTSQMETLPGGDVRSEDVNTEAPEILIDIEAESVEGVEYRSVSAASEINGNENSSECFPDGSYPLFGNSPAITMTVSQATSLLETLPGGEARSEGDENDTESPGRLIIDEAKSEEGVENRSASAACGNDGRENSIIYDVSEHGSATNVQAEVDNGSESEAVDDDSSSDRGNRESVAPSEAASHVESVVYSEIEQPQEARVKRVRKQKAPERINANDNGIDFLQEKVELMLQKAPFERYFKRRYETVI